MSATIGCVIKYIFFESKNSEIQKNVLNYSGNHRSNEVCKLWKELVDSIEIDELVRLNFEKSNDWIPTLPKVYAFYGKTYRELLVDPNYSLTEKINEIFLNKIKQSWLSLLQSGTSYHDAPDFVRHDLQFADAALRKDPKLFLEFDVDLKNNGLIINAAKKAGVIENKPEEPTEFPLIKRRRLF